MRSNREYNYGQVYTPPPMPVRLPHQTRRQARMAPLDSLQHRVAHCFRWIGNAIEYFLVAWLLLGVIWFHFIVPAPVLWQMAVAYSVATVLKGMGWLADGRWKDSDDDGRG